VKRRSFYLSNIKITFRFFFLLPPPPAVAVDGIAIV